MSIAQLALDKASPHVARSSASGSLIDHRFMIPKLFDRVMAWPHLRNAFYRDLADYDKNAFMPGVDDLPQDLIMLVQVNQYFIDAVMAGANFEMNRELLWRGFPTDLRGTPFQRFWGRVRLERRRPARAAERHGADAPVAARSRSACAPTRT